MIAAFTSLVFAATLLAQTVTDGDDAVEKRALTLLQELQSGTIDRTELSPSLNAEYTKAVLRTSEETIPAGAPTDVVRLSKTHVDRATTYVFRVRWPSGTLDYTFSYDDKTFEVVKLYVRTGPPV